MPAANRIGPAIVAALMAACSAGSTPATDGGASADGASADGGVVSPGNAPRASDYSVACTRAEDCVVADFSTNACCGGCGEGVIAKSDQARYLEDRNRFRASCTSKADCPDLSCASIRAICDAGMCKRGN